MSGHSELPPSSSNKWLNCHGWRKMVVGIPNVTSAAAEEGTLAHEWFAEYLLGNKDLADCPDEEMYENLIAPAEWVLDRMVIGDGELLVERRVDFGKAYGFADLEGTADVIGVYDTHHLIGDLKYGRQVVEVEKNTQMLCYLAGVIQEFGRRDFYELAILQPRAWHAKGPIRTWMITDEAFREWEETLVAAIKGSYSRSPKPTAGPWCQHYCPALGSCKAAAKRAIDAFALADLEDLEEEESWES